MIILLHNVLRVSLRILKTAETRAKTIYEKLRHWILKAIGPETIESLIIKNDIYTQEGKKSHQNLISENWVLNAIVEYLNKEVKSVDSTFQHQIKEMNSKICAFKTTINTNQLKIEALNVNLALLYEERWGLSTYVLPEKLDEINRLQRSSSNCFLLVIMIIYGFLEVNVYCMYYICMYCIYYILYIFTKICKKIKCKTNFLGNKRLFSNPDFLPDDSFSDDSFSDNSFSDDSFSDDSENIV
jgi:polyhydroxyalkanoate synthesis regulator phasin